MSLLALALTLSWAAPALADGLADARQALGGLRPEPAPASPIKARLQVQFSRQGSDDKRPTQGNLSLHASADPQGLRLLLPPSLLATAADEARAALRDPEHPAGLRAALRSLDAIEVAEMLDFGPVLLRQLGAAQLLREEPSTRDGQPARLLVLKMDAPLPAAQRKHLKSLQVEGRLLLGPDGVPLSFSYTARFKGSRFLISFEGEQQDERTLTRKGDRLIVSRQVHRESGSGLGQKGQMQRTTTLTAE